jgi:hypothetical protein
MVPSLDEAKSEMRFDAALVRSLLERQLRRLSMLGYRRTSLQDYEGISCRG